MQEVLCAEAYEEVYFGIVLPCFILPFLFQLYFIFFFLFKLTMILFHDLWFTCTLILLVFWYHIIGIVLSILVPFSCSFLFLPALI